MGLFFNNFLLNDMPEGDKLLKTNWAYFKHKSFTLENKRTQIKICICVVGVTGLEPAAPCPPDTYSTN